MFGQDCETGERSGQRPPAPIEAGSYWFRLLDPTSGKPIWMFKILAGFVYEVDKPFFHVFQGKVSNRSLLSGGSGCDSFPEPPIWFLV